MSTDGQDGRRGVGALLRDLADGSTALLREEVRLARTEIGRAAAGAGKGAALVAVGSALAMLGGLALLVGAVLLIGDQWLPADLYWVAALIVLVVSGALAAWFAKRGMSYLAPAGRAPRGTKKTRTQDKKRF